MWTSRVVHMKRNLYRNEGDKESLIGCCLTLEGDTIVGPSHRPATSGWLVTVPLGTMSEMKSYATINFRSGRDGSKQR